MKLPQLELTPRALEQIRLLKLNDYTLSEMDFRIKIGGKGCGGFTYETGFSERLPDDIVVSFEDCVILIDPFTAFYTQEAKIDFQLDLEHNLDGFIVDNMAGQKYAGKFFKNPELVPHWEKSP